MGIFIGRADGTHVVVQSLDESRPPEIGTDLPASAAYVFMLVENSDKGQTARWIVIDRNGRELRRIPPQPTTFDPRKRPWYGPALAATDTILTPPYRFANVPEAGITLARASRRTSGAVFGIDITSGEPGPIPGQAAVSGRSGVAGIRVRQELSSRIREGVRCARFGRPISPTAC